MPLKILSKKNQFGDDIDNFMIVSNINFLTFIMKLLKSAFSLKSDDIDKIRVKVLHLGS
jgi:hypothetical protein